MTDKENTKKGKNKNFAVGCLVFIVITIAIGSMLSGSYDKTKEKNEKENTVLSTGDKLETCFNQWDGSHINITKLLKDNMNDPKSYEHVETRYIYNSDDDITVFAKIRGNNGYGAKVLSMHKFQTNISCNVIKELAQ